MYRLALHAQQCNFYLRCVHEHGVMAAPRTFEQTKFINYSFINSLTLFFFLRYIDGNVVMNTYAGRVLEYIPPSDGVAFLKTFVVRRDWLYWIDAAVIRRVNEAISPSLQSQTSFLPLLKGTERHVCARLFVQWGQIQILTILQPLAHKLNKTLSLMWKEHSFKGKVN